MKEVAGDGTGRADERRPRVRLLNSSYDVEDRFIEKIGILVRRESILYVFSAFYTAPSVLASLWS